MEYPLTALKPWLWAGGVSAAAILFGLGVHFVVFAIARRFSKRTASPIDDFLVKYAEKPSRMIFPVLALLSAFPFLPLPAWILGPVRHFLGLALIACVAWLVVALINFLRDLVTTRYAMDVTDNLTARGVQTQVQVLRHVAVVVVVVVAGSIMLMTFPNVRNVGQSLFASAGVAALVAGLAARSTFTNLFAGIQIALTQPIRLEDVVVVEGEWGRIEEIRTTFVVVRIWDLRRLVVPISYFIDKPFQNWTRTTANLLGTVFLYTDYTVPVEAVRQELHRILESSGMWDGKVWGLQVTNTSERTMELRALMSAPTGPAAWDLRCYVREKLIEFMQREYPESLPKTRAELTGIPKPQENSESVAARS